MKKQLPFNPPIVASYPRHAYCLSVLNGEESCLNWIYSHYIQLHCKPSYRLQADWFDYVVSDPESNEIPFFSNRFHTIPRQFIANMNLSLIEFITSAIDKEYYIILNVDERFLPGSWAYGTFDLPHAIFIYGYDSEYGRFDVAGFFQDNKYTRLQIGMEDVQEAYVQAGKWAEPNRTYEVYGNLEYMNLMYAFQFNSNANYNLDWKHIKGQFEDFVHSRPPSARNTYQQETEPHVYGIQVYDYLGQVFEQTMLVDKSSSFDHRPFQTLVEHKQLMIDRIDFLERRGFTRGSDEIREAYRLIHMEALSIRGLLLKFMMKEDRDEKMIHTILQKLRQMKISEKAALEKWMEGLVEMEKCQ